jgi:hypothetical protein
MKYILGGGISGLIWNFYHPEFTIITPKESVENYTRSYLVWLHDSYETRKLLKDLGLEVKLKQSNIGYFRKGWIYDSPTTDMNLVLIQKKMTPWNKELDTQFVPKSTDMSMTSTGSTNYMNTLDVNLAEVVRRLKEKVQIEYGYVVKIDDKTITIKQDFSPGSTEKVKSYEKLVSTIPAPLFWKAYEQERQFDSFPITSIITNKKPLKFYGKYEMVYYDDSMPFTRVSSLNGNYAIEFTGIIERDEFTRLFPELPILDYVVIKQGRIISNGENTPPNNIIFSGRFAKWNYGISTENVIYDAINTKI